MKQQSIEALIGDVRNKLQPFWTLVDMVRIPIQGDIVVAAELAYKQEQAIITALEEIVNISEEKKYSEDDIIKMHIKYIEDVRGMYHTAGDVMQMKEVIKLYNEQKQDANNQ